MFGVREQELPDGEKVATQYRHVTDRRTDILPRQSQRLCIAARGKSCFVTRCNVLITS